MMRAIDKERWIGWAAVPLLAAVLVTLAVMQYRWSGQVSEATRAQMQAGLQTSLMGFHQDLARELGSLCMEIKTAFDDSSAGDPAQLGQQVAHWQQTAAHPGLLEHLYLWQSGNDDMLLRLDPSGAPAESVPWPAEFVPLHAHLQAVFPPQDFPMPMNGAAAAMHAHHHGRGNRAGMGPRQGNAFLPWAVDQSNLVLASPAHRVVQASGGNSKMAITWIIIQLNRGVLEKEIFPELSQKYFHGQPGQEYEVAVLESNKAGQRIAYSSVSRFGENNGRPVDASINLFGAPFRRGGPPGADPGFFGPPGQQAAAQASDTRRPPDRMVRFEPMRDSADPLVYELVVKHQRGSLEAAVSDLRRRSLMVSFGVLLLLAATMALIVVGAQRARRLARMQMDFVAGVSHELRTPLAVISSAAENIADGVIEDRQRVVQYGRSILKQSRQLTQLVEQVLLYASSEKARRRLDIRPVEVASAVDSALEGTAAMVKNSGVEIDRRFDSDLPPVSADFNALVQCLQNLITNAVKYGGENRWLGIKATSTRPAGGAREVLLSVEDRGMGISHDEIRQIFEPFYRGASAVDAQIHGTGLGLPLARTLVEAMGGKLTAESEPGRGSSFTIHLPVAQGAQAAASPASLSKVTTAAGHPSSS
ncbi:MAG: HAMP domain-containing histidine kinase [Acidobacteriia bacterium]|nr:HAMP domain-containing histidine kinase [Terriglobia bacterium]